MFYMEFETEIENHLFVLPYNIKINKSINTVWVRAGNGTRALNYHKTFLLLSPLVHIVRCPSKFKYYLKIDGARTMFCRVIGGK